MCCNIAYALAAATGDRREADRPAEWKGESTDAEDDDEEREAAVAAA
ncbi:MAG: hypothetical protein ABEJ23_09520 [Haloarculaceae archaeon]